VELTRIYYCNSSAFQIGIHTAVEFSGKNKKEKERGEGNVKP
jgi:hypothetical protein